MNINPWYKALEEEIAGSNDKHIFKILHTYFGKTSVLVWTALTNYHKLGGL